MNEPATDSATDPAKNFSGTPVPPAAAAGTRERARAGTENTSLSRRVPGEFFLVFIPVKSLRERARSLLANPRSCEIFSYLFWGAATTLVSLAVYGIATRLVGLDVVPATVVSWILSVLFAFVTNKFWVFDSRSVAPLTVLRELVSFVSARLTSGGMEVFMMWFFVDILGVNDWLMKIVANIVVIIANYIFSVVFVFRKGKERK